MPDPALAPARPSSRCPRSRSPTTARWPARSTSTRRRATRGSSRSSAARSTSPTTAARTRGYAHLTLLAESNTGYSNLIKLGSLGYLEGYYTKPRVDWELLERYSGGLIALSGCLSGRVCKALEESRRGRAADLDRLAQVFGRDNTYVELQNAGLEVQQRVNPELVQLAAEAKLPLVATGDVHYLSA